MTATYVISVHDTGVDWLNEQGRDNLTCDHCSDSCEDAHHILVATGVDTRDQHCIRCQPSSLCARCSVRIGDAKVCLMCMTDTEAEYLPKTKQRRRQLVQELAEA